MQILPNSTVTFTNASSIPVVIGSFQTAHPKMMSKDGLYARSTESRCKRLHVTEKHTKSDYQDGIHEIGHNL